MESLGRFDDRDPDPEVLPPPDTGLLGDGLAAFEEFRGFVVDGNHTRTDPQKKDYFITWAPGFGSALPLDIHQIRGEDEYPGATEYRVDRVINANRSNSGSGGAIEGFDQRAVRLVEIPDYKYGYFGFTCWAESPETNCEDWVPPPDTPLPLRFLPSSTRVVKVWPATHNDLGNETCNTLSHLPGVSCPYNASQVANEIMRTFGHELGHTIGMCHRGRNQCAPLDESGVPPSLMFDAFAGGPSSDNEASQYNEFDKRQIRLHANAVLP